MFYADVAELADALDLGSSSDRSEGSSPFIRISKIVLTQRKPFHSTTERVEFYKITPNVN